MESPDENPERQLRLVGWAGSQAQKQDSRLPQRKPQLGSFTRFFLMLGQTCVTIGIEVNQDMKFIIYCIGNPFF
jgi:hypothetical protein